MDTPKFNIGDWVTFKDEPTQFYCVTSVKIKEQQISYHCKFYHLLNERIETTSLREEDLISVTASPNKDPNLWKYYQEHVLKYAQMTKEQKEQWNEFVKQLQYFAKNADFTKLNK